VNRPDYAQASSDKHIHQLAVEEGSINCPFNFTRGKVFIYKGLSYSVTSILLILLHMKLFYFEVDFIIQNSVFFYITLTIKE